MCTGCALIVFEYPLTGSHFEAEPYTLHAALRWRASLGLALMKPYTFTVTVWSTSVADAR